MGYCSCLNYLSFLLASLDVLTSFAVVAACAPIPYVRPQMMPMGSGTFTVQQARHACVEVQDSVSFIPNDVFFKQGTFRISAIFIHKTVGYYVLIKYLLLFYMFMFKSVTVIYAVFLQFCSVLKIINFKNELFRLNFINSLLLVNIDLHLYYKNIRSKCESKEKLY